MLMRVDEGAIKRDCVDELQAMQRAVLEYDIALMQRAAEELPGGYVGSTEEIKALSGGAIEDCIEDTLRTVATEKGREVFSNHSQADFVSDDQRLVEVIIEECLPRRVEK